MDDLQKHIQELLQDPEFKKAWEESELEYQIARTVIKRRKELGLSQEELAKILNTGQSAISRIESCQNITLNMLQKLAAALQLDVEIRLVPRA
ncbi:MAG: helix-turn-helix domain-containing protein [Zhaonellaceae bacterium]|jgi:ribosome-binding protein aMBF1 (putative translation factor)|nr:helix-turn-helix domain-containing protein [Clostridia bacterium]